MLREESEVIRRRSSLRVQGSSSVVIPFPWFAIDISLLNAESTVLFFHVRIFLRDTLLLYDKFLIMHSWLRGAYIGDNVAC